MTKPKTLSTTELLARLSEILGAPMRRGLLYTWFKQGLIEPPAEQIEEGNIKPTYLWPMATVHVCEARVKENKERMLSMRTHYPNGKRPIKPVVAAPGKKKTEASVTVAPVKAPVKEEAKAEEQAVSVTALRRQVSQAIDLSIELNAEKKEVVRLAAQNQATLKAQHKKEIDRLQAEISAMKAQDVENAQKIDALTIKLSEVKGSDEDPSLEEVKAALLLKTKEIQRSAQEAAENAVRSTLVDAEASLIQERARYKTLADKAVEQEKESAATIQVWKAKVTELEGRLKKRPTIPNGAPSVEVFTVLEREIATLRVKANRAELALQRATGESGEALTVAQSNLIKAWLLGLIWTQTQQAKHSANIAEIPLEVALKVIEHFDLRFELTDAALRLHSAPRERVAIDTGTPLALRKVRKELAASDNS